GPPSPSEGGAQYTDRLGSTFQGPRPFAPLSRGPSSRASPPGESVEPAGGGASTRLDCACRGCGEVHFPRLAGLSGRASPFEWRGAALSYRGPRPGPRRLPSPPELVPGTSSPPM